MPGMDGVEATEHIRALGGEEPYYRNVPIIALTANAVTGMKEMFLQSGFDDYLSKPIDTVMLNTILEKWIPKEKQAGSAVKNRKAVNASKPILNVIEIEGLDTNKGVHLSGGTVEFYHETLAAFYDDGLERKNEIRDCLDAGNLSLYLTYVHALKSASANIGADKLSKAAYALEIAGQQGDLDFIKMNNAHFLMMLERLLNDIGNALSSLGANSDKAYNTLEREQFKTELAKLKSAIEDMDVGVINKTVDVLLKSACTDDVKSVMRNISRHILKVEYDEANTLIESLLE